MLLREEYERKEMLELSPYAKKSIETLGRDYYEQKCEIRTEFQRDRDRILHSKSFRRLKHKTQVFLSPEGDHYRTRLTHTLEVAQISRTIARALRLNEDLCEAIALGHDLGHTPFGHSGEDVLNAIHSGGFRHNEQSIRVVEYLENNKREFKGLNLTSEVKDGILNHNGNGLPITLEGQVVKYCDKIAYINHDIDDAIRGNVLTIDDIPKELLDIVGYTHSTRINNMIIDIIKTSDDKTVIEMSESFKKAMFRLRNFMFENVYLSKNAKAEEGKAKYIIEQLYYYFIKNPQKMSQERFEDYSSGLGDIAIKDYVAGMTDRYAVKMYEELFIPKFWK
jgi:dGTPase